MQLDALAFLPHPTDITDIAPPTIRLCSLRSAGLVKRVWPAPDQWLQDQMAACWAGFTSPGLCRVCAFVLLRCFSCSHTVLPKEHSLGIIFFSSLSSCKCCIFLQFYLHFTTDYTCMIVYVTNNKEPWRASERTGACLAANALPHKHFNSAHFSRLTSYWAAM